MAVARARRCGVGLPLYRLPGWGRWPTLLPCADERGSMAWPNAANNMAFPRNSAGAQTALATFREALRHGRRKCSKTLKGLSAQPRLSPRVGDEGELRADLRATDAAVRCWWRRSSQAGQI